MSHMLAKKQEEWNSQKVKELLRLPENKKCFDCPTKSPFFVNVSIQTFLCTRCSGLVREVGHRVKSISASKFSGPEIVALQHGGNEVARTIWLNTYRMTTPEPETDGDVRLFMRQKYYEQKWLDRKKGVAHAENVKRIIKELYSEDGTRKSTTLGRSGSMNNKSGEKRASMDVTHPKIVPTQSWVDDNVPIGLIPTVQQNKTNNNNHNNLDDLLLNDDMMLSPKSPKFPTISQPSSMSNNNIAVSPTSPSSVSNHATPTTPTRPASATTTSDIFTELAGLSPSRPVATPTYAGGILQPNSPISPSSSIAATPAAFQLPQMNNNNNTQQKPVVFTNSNKFADLDPYAALRDLSIGSKPATPTSATHQQPHTSLNSLKIKTSDDISSWGDFQKSPTQLSFNNKPNNTSSMFGDLDPLFKR